MFQRGARCENLTGVHVRLERIDKVIVAIVKDDRQSQVVYRCEGSRTRAQHNTCLALESRKVASVTRLGPQGVRQRGDLLGAHDGAEGCFETIEGLLVWNDHEHSSPVAGDLRPQGRERAGPIIAGRDLPRGAGDVSGEDGIDEGFAVEISGPSGQVRLDRLAEFLPWRGEIGLFRLRVARRDCHANDIRARAAVAFGKRLHESRKFLRIDGIWRDHAVDKAQRSLEFSLRAAGQDDAVLKLAVEANAHANAGLGDLGLRLVDVVVERPVQVRHP